MYIVQSSHRSNNVSRLVPLRVCPVCPFAAQVPLCKYKWGKGPEFSVPPFAGGKHALDRYGRELSAKPDRQSSHQQVCCQYLYRDPNRTHTHVCVCVYIGHLPTCSDAILLPSAPSCTSCKILLYQPFAPRRKKEILRHVRRRSKGNHTITHVWCV